MIYQDKILYSDLFFFNSEIAIQDKSYLVMKAMIVLEQLMRYENFLYPWLRIGLQFKTIHRW